MWNSWVQRYNCVHQLDFHSVAEQFEHYIDPKQTNEKLRIEAKKKNPLVDHCYEQMVLAVNRVLVGNRRVFDRNYLLQVDCNTKQ